MKRKNILSRQCANVILSLSQHVHKCTENVVTGHQRPATIITTTPKTVNIIAICTVSNHIHCMMGWISTLWSEYWPWQTNRNTYYTTATSGPLRNCHHTVWWCLIDAEKLQNDTPDDYKQSLSAWATFYTARNDFTCPRETLSVHYTGIHYRRCIGHALLCISANCTKSPVNLATTLLYKYHAIYTDSNVKQR